MSSVQSLTDHKKRMDLTYNILNVLLSVDPLSWHLQL